MTARRRLRKLSRQRIRIIFDWCIAQGHRSDNPANGSLDAVLPKSGHRTKNHEAAAVADAARIVEEARTAGTATWHGARLAFRFAVLTVARTKEVLGARWNEIDLDARLWTVPAARMKRGIPHRVPLSDAAVEVLEAARARWGTDGLVFRNSRREALDEAALRRVVRKVDPVITVHGFRSTFRDWAAANDVPDRVAEFSIAHRKMTDSEASYFRTDLLDKRRAVMARWGRFVTGSTAPKVVDIRTGAA